MFAYKDLFWQLTLREMKARYKQSVLGYARAIIVPLLNLLTLSIDKLLRHLNRVLSGMQVWRKAQLSSLSSPKGMREVAAETFLHGEGIEVGALHQPLWVPAGVKVRYVDRLSIKDLRKHYPELRGYSLVNVDVIDDGETLSSIKPESLDFIVANHFLEHCQNLIKTLLIFFSKLRPKGILYMAIPNKDYSFDIKRPVTSYQHIVADYKYGPHRSKKSHYEEWTKLVDGIKDLKEAVKHTRKLMQDDYSIHFHVWDQVALMSLFFKLRRFTGFKFDIVLMLSNSNEIILVLRKH